MSRNALPPLVTSPLGAERTGPRPNQPLNDQESSSSRASNTVIPTTEQSAWTREATTFLKEPLGTYEPVGELLTERRHPGTSRSDIDIPQPVDPAESAALTFSTNDITQASCSIQRLPLPTLKRKIPFDVSRDTRSYPLVRSISGPDTMSGPSQSASDQPMGPPSAQETASRTRMGRTRSNTIGASADVEMDVVTDTGDDLSRAPERPATTQRRSTMVDMSSMQFLLPARKVFPIQIGSELFRLSGASISSDAPSYFSQFFEEQLKAGETPDSVRTLYIDRDPVTFRDISLHLQGYHIEPRDGTHFVRLFADAQFFSLPKLTQQLFKSTIYVRIGDEEFAVPRDLFNSPGDSPNYFSLGFAIFFTTPTQVFPGLNQRTLLRPPSILPPQVAGRSAQVFADLLHVLKGYDLRIRDDEHRAELLRDARYYHLKGLEQKLLAHHISYNSLRQKKEMMIRLEDIRQSGISFVADQGFASDSSSASASSGAHSPIVHSDTVMGDVVSNTAGWVNYQRPFVDDTAYELVLELGTDSTRLSVARRPSLGTYQGVATFHDKTKARISSLVGVILTKLSGPQQGPVVLDRISLEAVNEQGLRFVIGTDADLVLDGRRAGGFERDDDPSSADIGGRSEKRHTIDDKEAEEWTVHKGLWRVRMQPVEGRDAMEPVLHAVKLKAFTSERGRNVDRDFL